MSTVEKISTVTFIIGIYMPVFACAAGLDDIQNYQPPAKAESKGAQPYTIQDIIQKVPQHLNARGIYVDDQESWADRNKARAEAFDKENFGECKELYFDLANASHQNGGGWIFIDTLKFLFSATEGDKADASRSLRERIKFFEYGRKSDRSIKDRCTDENVARQKEILNAVIDAAPSILEEKRRSVEAAQGTRRKLQNQANEKAKVKEQAEAKEKADRQAMQLAEAKGNEERANKLKACENENAYKLYEVSATIDNNREMANRARVVMQQQEEGAKVSGYVDKNVMYKMGNIVAGAERLNKDNFELYKKLGGTAWTIDSVKVLPNPCDM